MSAWVTAARHISNVNIIIYAVCLSSLRNLSCQRITLHKNLFVSYVLNSALTLIYLIAVVNNPDVVGRNPVSVTLLYSTHITVQYITEIHFTFKVKKINGKRKYNVRLCVALHDHFKIILVWILKNDVALEHYFISFKWVYSISNNCSAAVFSKSVR